MKILTAAILKALPAIGTTSNMRAEAIKVPLKVFNPGGSQSWFITEYDPKSGEAFGYVTGMGNDELGYIDMNELLTVRGHFGLPMERDSSWDPKTTLAAVMSGVKS